MQRTTTSTSLTSCADSVVDSALASRYHEVMADIADAARLAGRLPEEIATVVVTKFHPPQLVRDLAALGVRDVGESRHQEALPKFQECEDLGLNWHFVGQLQSNKARAVASYCTTIHSLDRPSVVKALATIDGEVGVFIEVNLTDDPGRGGVLPLELEAFATTVLETSALNLLGLMAVAPQDEDPARAFDRVSEIRENFLRVAPGSRQLSLGMSGDYREAIAVGATHLRIGTAITGKRP